MNAIQLRIVKSAQRYHGMRETAPNRGPIEIFQRRWGSWMIGQPYCGAYVFHVWDEAGVPKDQNIGHPSTAEMCRRAKEKGWLSDTPIIGGAIILCGTHTGIVTGIGPGVVYTEEANTGDMVTNRVRKTSDWQYINLPCLGNAGPSQVDDVLYWLDDPGAKFRVLPGRWRFRRFAERSYATLRPDVKKRARVVQAGNGKYVIRVGEPPRYGPFPSRKQRDEKRVALEKKMKRKLRPYRTASQVRADAIGKTD